VDSIGAWLLETREFQRWHNGSLEDEASGSTLCCGGNPAPGKSDIV